MEEFKMKKILFYSISIALLFQFVTTATIAQDTMYVYKTDGVINKTAIENIDSITFISSFIPDETVTDIDGNVYNTVAIGTQTWMVENLKTTRYYDGTSISNPTSNGDWENNTDGAYSWYNNNPAGYKDPYGALYNWAAVNSNKLCPPGWRVPTETDWEALIDFLGADAGSKLKEVGTEHWNEPNTDATNETGFTAVGGGHRWHTGAFAGVRDVGYYWSSTEKDEETSHAYYMGPSYPRLEKGAYNKVIRGLSVRCIKE